MCKGLAPLYRIGPRSDGGRRTGAMSGEVFFGRTDGRTVDKKRRKNFVLGSPVFWAKMKQLSKVNECPKDNIFEKSSHKNRNMGKETYNIIQEYSEYSTIQGIVYIFQRSQTTFGKIFWNIVVVLMLILGTYWSVEAYNNWENNQVKINVIIKSWLIFRKGDCIGYTYWCKIKVDICYCFSVA